MPSENPGSNPSRLDKTLLREQLFLAEQAGRGGIKVVPGKPGEGWKWHYPQGGAQGAASLQGVLDGQVKPAEVNTKDLKPKGLIYDPQDLQVHGLEAVQGAIRDQTSRMTHYDWQGMVDFCGNLRVPKHEFLYEQLRFFFLVQLRLLVNIFLLIL